MAYTETSFNGFPQETFEFLRDLTRNNNKAWFDVHRGIYDEVVRAPALSFVRAMGAVLQSMAPSITPEAWVNGSLFRIHRDTRFTADKSPYKTHVGIRFRDRDASAPSKCAGPLFYVEFDARILRLGVGVKVFDPRTLSAYRRWVAGDIGTEEVAVLKEAVARSDEKNGIEILGARLSRPPRGFSDRPNQDLLMLKGFFVRRQTALPEAIHSPGFVEYCAGWFQPNVPVFEFLRKVASSAQGVKA